MKLSRYNRNIIFISAVSGVIVAGTFIYFLSLWYRIDFTLASWIVGLILVLQTTSLLLYEKFNTARIKLSFGRFIKQIKEGNYESEKSYIIQKYDFVNITDIQIELSELVGQIRSDYNEQKRYIENVSHELMTPIAIIRGKLELLIQSENIEKSDFKLINDILLKLDRLKRVNQSLVLLSKIDYNHYKDKSLISFNDIIDETLNLFEDQIRVDGLLIRKKLNRQIRFDMNENLAYILIKNIMKNAVIHNVENGFIHIEESPNRNGIIISNSGMNIKTSTDQLFERFHVEGNYADSIGLGLSIVSRICEVSEIRLSYKHEQGVHKVEISI